MRTLTPFLLICMATAQISGTKGVSVSTGVSLTVNSAPTTTSCTSSATIPPPTVAPFSGLVGAGTFVSNPEPANYATYGCFSTPMSRITDSQIGYNACVAQGASPTNCAARQNKSWFVNNSDGQDSQFSLDDTQFWGVDSGNAIGIFNNNYPAAATLRYMNYPNGLLKLYGAPSYSHVTNKLGYAMANPGLTAQGQEIFSYDFSQTWPTLPTTTGIYNFAASGMCGLVLPPSAIYNTDTVTINYNDTVMVNGLSTSGTQNTARYVVAYKVGSGCSMLSLASGSPSAVTGDWGTTGSAQCPNCPVANESPGTGPIHNVKMDPSGTYAIIGLEGCDQSANNTALSELVTTVTVTSTLNPGNGNGVWIRDVSPGGYNGYYVVTSSGPTSFQYSNSNIGLGPATVFGASWQCFTGSGTPYVWQIGTRNVYSLCASYSPNDCSGHQVTGYNGVIMQYSTPYYNLKTFSGIPTGVNSTFPATWPCTPTSPAWDTHPSWWNNSHSSQDQNPFYTSTALATGGNPSYTMCTAAEIISIYSPSNTGMSGDITRWAHNYLTDTGEFQAQYALMTESQTGHYALFTSAMGNQSTFIGQLGSEAGQYPCTGSPEQCRADIFMIQTYP